MSVHGAGYRGLQDLLLRPLGRYLAYGEFKKACYANGLTGDLRLLFNGLDFDSDGHVSYDDFRFLQGPGWQENIGRAVEKMEEEVRRGGHPHCEYFSVFTSDSKCLELRVLNCFIST